jgi:hypothetical protein
MPDDWRNPAELPLDWMPLRRPSEKVGRNDPCPCGSGKKYKRCCEARDRERAASPYAGMTMQEALAEPGRHGDPRIIEKIPEEQLAAIDRQGLSSAQLVTLVRRLAELKRWGEADQVLSDLAARDDELGQRVNDTRAELVRSLLLAKEGERVHAHVEAVGEAQDPLFAAAGLMAAAMRGEKDVLFRLDRLLRVEIDHGPCVLEIADMLRAGGAPAVALGLLRAACFEQLHPEELDLLNEDVEALRAELELGAQDAVVGAHIELLERLEEERARPDLLEQKTQQNAELLAKLREARQVLRDLEARRAAADSAAGSETHGGERSDEQSREGKALKRKVEQLKAEIRAQQEERRELRERLKSSSSEESRRAAPRDRERPAADGADPAEDGGSSLPDQRPLRPVEFSDAFERSLGGIDPRIVLKAQEQAIRFASYDPAIWRHAKKLADFEDLYSLRIGIHHRLLLRRSGEGGVEVRDLVTRERHDAIVARYRG